MGFSKHLEKLKDNQTFLNAFSLDTGYSKSNIVEREIISSVKFIRLKMEEELQHGHFSKNWERYGEKNINKAFCLLPGNAPLYAFCAKVLVPCICTILN